MMVIYKKSINGEVTTIKSLPSNTEFSINAPSNCSQTRLDTEHHFDKWSGAVTVSCMPFSLMFNQVFSKRNL